MTAVELMYAVAERAKVLANETLPILRLYVSVDATTWHGAQVESKHLNRGELIELILEEEFEDKAKEIDNESTN